MVFSMKHTLSIALSASLVFAVSLALAGDGGKPGGQKAASYYGWLDKFENPARQPIASAQQNSHTVLTEKNVSDASVQPETASGEQLTSSEEGNEANVSEIAFEEDTTEPGEGLGCYYHRAYYSHLPMFKDDVYSLRGSFDVSETFNKPSEEIVSSADEVPHKK